MTEVKWIKIVTDIFDDEKMLLIESMPESDAIIVIWFKLLCLAGKNNNQGVFTLNNRIAYTDEMLSTIFRRPLNTIRLALKTFENYGMIELINNVITIPNWSKHQTLDQLEKKRVYQREYMANKRAEQKKIALCETNYESNSESNVSCLEEDIEIEEEIDIDIDNNKEEEKSSIPYQGVIDLYNSICGSKLPAVKYLSEDRKRLIKTAWNRLKDSDAEKLDIFKNLFNITAKNSFLIGENVRGWRADFNWLLKEKNMIKVLENSYASGSKKNTGNFDNFEHREYDYDNLEKELLGQTNEEPEDGGAILTMEEIKKRAKGMPNDNGPGN